MITNFREKYFFLSNFYPVRVEYEGRVFPSTEHAYQAQKCPQRAKEFNSDLTAGQAKRLGASVPIRSDWEEAKVQIMLDLLRKKFADGTLLATQLLFTADEELIEENSWGDTYWGVYNGVGQNKLGKLLMQVRDELIKKKEGR